MAAEHSRVAAVAVLGICSCGRDRVGLFQRFAGAGEAKADASIYYSLVGSLKRLWAALCPELCTASSKALYRLAV